MNFSDHNPVRDVLNRLHGRDTNKAAGARAGDLGTGKLPKPPAAPVAPVSASEHNGCDKLLGYPDVKRLYARKLQQTEIITSQQFWDGIKLGFKAKFRRKNGSRDGGNMFSSYDQSSLCRYLGELLCCIEDLGIVASGGRNDDFLFYSFRTDTEMTKSLKNFRDKLRCRKQGPRDGASKLFEESQSALK